MHIRTFESPARSSLLLSGLVFIATHSVAAQAQPPLPPPPGPTFEGCPVFPPDHPFNTDISQAPLDAHSNEFMLCAGGA